MQGKLGEMDVVARQAQRYNASPRHDLTPHIDNHCIALTSSVVASTNQRRVPIPDSADRLLATITPVITANPFYLVP
jgi:hypothetical protein